MLWLAITLTPIILLVFWLPALILWSPIYALALWHARKNGMRRLVWLWAWIVPATLTVLVLGFTGFIGDVLGSV